MDVKSDKDFDNPIKLFNLSGKIWSSAIKLFVGAGAPNSKKYCKGDYDGLAQCISTAHLPIPWR